jgi:c-di-GMP phosphodiesterase
MTGPNERMAPERLAEEYASALRQYVSGAGEAALTRAYELGRSAAGSGVGLLELAVLHHEALAHLPHESLRDGRPAPVAMAAQFLAESLSPFEMTLRSYQDNARLLGLGGDLAQENAEIGRAREQLRTILDATTAVIYLKDAAGRYLFVNRQFQEVFGLRREQILGKLDDEVLPPAVARMLRNDDLLVLEARAPREVEETLPGADGAHTYLSLKFPLLDARGLSYGLSCVATDITERKRAEEALQREREAAERERRLQEAVEVRDQFLTIASHELRTPLTALELQVGSLQRLARSSPEMPVSDERILSKCDLMVRQVERLTVLIDGLVDVGRMASGRLELHLEALELGALVRGVLARAEGAIRRSGSEVVLTSGDPVVGTWDRARLETAVASLVSNAVKFGAGKPVDVVVEATGGRAFVTVRDRGIGISPDDQRRIFERFERAVSVRHYGGFGVGLWLARQAVEAHGGAIHVRSEDGAGSEFRIELPLEAAPA